MHQVFTRKEALAAGIEGRQLRGRRYRALSRGLYCRADAAPSETQIVAALLRKLPAAEFACRQTAAVLLGAVVPRSSVVHLGSVERRSSKRDDVQLHWYRKPPTLTDRGGIDVTTGAQTFADLSTELPFVDLLVLGDSLVQAGAMTIEQLAETSFDHRTGASSARAVAGLVRAGVESPYESRTRLLLVSAGLPEPLVNHPIRDDTGHVRRRIDLAYPEFKIAIEYDGRHHIEREGQWRSDIRRREELEADGWIFIVLTSRDIHRQPADTVSRVADALNRRGHPTSVDHVGWRRHFAS